MGKLAKIGIIRGKKVPVEGLLSNSVGVPDKLNKFEQSSLHSFGFGEIGQKIVDRDTLDAHDIEMLLSNAPLSLLIKLVELNGAANTQPNLVPAIYLPLEAWMRSDDVQGAADLALQRIDASGLEAVWVFTDVIDFFDLESEWPDLITELKRSIPSVRVIAPPVGVILKWISFHHRVKNRAERYHQLESVLRSLSDVGFDDLAESAYRHSLPIVQRSSFDPCILTRIDRHLNTKLLTNELLRVREVSADSDGDLIWCAGVPHDRGRERFAGVALDMMVVRVMAVGALALPRVKLRRGYTRYLQPDSLELLPKVGVNEYVFHSVDRQTLERFGFPLVGEHPTFFNESRVR